MSTESKQTDASPQAPLPQEGTRETGAPVEPGQYQLVREADGREFWKLTCECGKRVRMPALVEQAYGRCPKCGQRIKLPGYQPKMPVLVSAKAGEGPKGAPPAGSALAVSNDASPEVARAANSRLPVAHSPAIRAEDEAETVSAAAVSDSSAGLAYRAAHPVGHDAAAVAADRLRPQRSDKKSGASAGASERISAWPLAGKVARALAAFIDLTFAMTAAGVVVVLSSQQVLPPVFMAREIILVTLALAGILNDGLVHLIWGGSLGKKLVVIVTRTAAGEPMSAARTLARAVLKWLLIPGWVIGAVDPGERTLHDLLCGTLVLKGRARRK